MLRTVADLLKGFLNEEKEKLDSFQIRHGPTIGKMYEGLTSNILTRAIPEQIGLRIVTGIIFDDSGEMTGEIDCMLVEGEGIEIPHTSSYKWHIKDVICVFEVKKNLYSEDLSDSFNHLRKVLCSYSRYVESGNAKENVNISSARKAFSQITKIIPPFHADADKLPLMQEILYHTLVTEQLSPIRIVLDYHGFKSEYSFRKAMIGFLEDNLNQQGLGVGSFPQLIICDKYSIVKANGQPYSPPMRNEYWDFLVSSSENPLVFILELIWTRLDLKYNLGGLWGEDLDIESFHLLLSGKVVEKEGKVGWEYLFTQIANEVLENKYMPKEWEPTFLDLNQFTIISKLCSGIDEDITNPQYITWLTNQGIDSSDFLDSLLNTGLLALDGSFLRLTTECCQCAILPTGEYIAAENNTGRLFRWIESKKLKKNRPEL